MIISITFKLHNYNVSNFYSKILHLESHKSRLNFNLSSLYMLIALQADMERLREEMRLENRRAVNIGSECDQDIET